ncbi:MAG: site-2 protease family protein [Candidatus Hodarchaeota archaeon]
MSIGEEPNPEETEAVYVPDTYLLELRDIVKEEFTVKYAYIDGRDNFPVFIIEEDSAIKERSTKLSERLRPHNLLAVIRQVELFEGTGEKNTVIKLVPAPPPRTASNYRMNIILFAITVVTVLVAGWFFATNPALDYIYNSIFGIPYNPYIVMVQYSIAILAIIGLHELGHYGISRFHRIEASLPYFIPGIYYGTFGALIVQRSPPPNRDSLFDMGISGPLVGFAVAIVVVIVGLWLSPVLSPTEYASLVAYLETIPGITAPSWLPTPLLFDIIWSFMTVGIPLNYTAYIHPVAFAGWVGFLITAINYFPIGQLDGGHVSRSLIGARYHQLISYAAVFILFILQYWWMALIAFFLFSGRHPGPVDDVSPVSSWRRVVGALSYLMPVLLLPPLVGGFFF